MTWFLKDKELKFFFRLLHSPSSARPSGLNYCGATSGAVPSHLSLQDWAGYLFISTPLCPVFTSAITCHYYYYFFNNYFIYFIFGCVGSSFLCEGFLQLRRVGATLHRDARASHYRGLSCCGAQAPDGQAQ